MGNLLKSDLYRLVHGKMLWVVTGVLVAIAVLAAALMYEVSSPGRRDELRDDGDGFAERRRR